MVMMDFDLKTVPSRMFIRFVARKQLLVDMTGQATPVYIKRMGRNPFVQQLTPGGEPTIWSSTRSDEMDGSRMGVLLNRRSDRPNPKAENSGSSAFDGSDAPSSKIEPSTTAEDIDEELFKAIVDTTFTSSRHPELFQPCGTVEAATEVEARLITEIISAYRRIKAQQENPIIQRLNNLL